MRMGSLGTGWAGFFLNPEPGHTEGGTPPLTPQFIFFSYGTSAYSTRMICDVNTYLVRVSIKFFAKDSLKFFVSEKNSGHRLAGNTARK